MVKERMDLLELLRKGGMDGDVDFLREALRVLVEEIMDAEVSSRIGAEYGERSPERVTQRNGYRSRAWDTRVGTMDLHIPKLREGSYFPSLLEPRRRSERALLAVIQQAYVEGVSTRRVDDLVKALGCEGISKSQVALLRPVLDVDGPKKRPKLELNPPADAVVRRIFDMALQGKSTLDIAKTLNAEGIPTSNGKKWLKTTVHFVLTNEAYGGTVVWGEKAKDGQPPVRVEDAHPGIVSKQEFRRIARMMESRAPKKVNPRRISSPYLLSGIAKCETCGKAMTAAEAKSGKYTYYICHSLLKRGKGTCKTPRLNAKKFEKIIVDELRANILTESNIRDLVKLLDEEMDGVARDQRERLESIDGELEEVKNQLGRVWHFIAKSDSVDVDVASDLIVELRERKETLEVAAEEARGLLKERRQLLDSADTIATFAEEMSEFLKTSELTETRAFVHSFVKEVQVKPGKAAIIYSIPTPDDSPIGGADAAEIALNGRVMNSVLPGGPGATGSTRAGSVLTFLVERVP